jgi:tetratricopeptide (TPR) repeat protein
MAGRRRLEAIAILQTEYALSGGLDPKDVSFQIDMAHRALTISTWTLTGRMSRVADEVQRAREFLPHWLALATNVLLSYGVDRNAKAIVDEGLELFPDDERLLFWRGAVLEYQAVWIGVSAINHEAATRATASSQLTSALIWAPVENAYRHALVRDQNDYETHLHLGYALYSLARKDPARTEYELARDQSPDPFVVYVADLLLARTKEDQNDPVGAAQDYEHALAKMPNAQSAYVGLSLLETRRGNSQRARELTMRLAAIPEDQRVRDPWWAFHASSRVPADDLNWLHTAVQQR